MNRHLSLSVDHHGDKLGVINFRKFFAWYTKGVRNARMLRPRAVKANTAAEMRALIGEIEMPLSPDSDLQVSPEALCDRHPGSSAAPIPEWSCEDR